MLDLLVKSAVRRKIVGLFALNPDQKFYPRQVAKEIEESPHAVGLELNHLAKGGLLKIVRENERKYYQWNDGYSYSQELQNIVLGETRKKQLERNLKKAVRILREKYHPDKIIAFGSFASGKIGPDSDLDLLLVKQNVPQRYWDRIKEVSSLLESCDVGIDYVIWKPEEIEEGLKNNLFLKQEILGKGKVVYERAL